MQKIPGSAISHVLALTPSLACGIGHVTNLGTGDFIAIDTQTNPTVQRVMLDGRPVGVQFSRDSKRVYVTDTGVFTPQRPGQVSVFDADSGLRLGDEITVGAGPTSIPVDSPGR